MPYHLVFLSSFSTLFFEIMLVRIFSIKLSYHFASLIIGISIFGIVLGSLYVHLRKKKIGINSEKAFIILAFLFPFQFVLSFYVPFDHLRLLWEKIQIVYLILQIVLFILPFFAYGHFISICLRENFSLTPKIYAADLLGGAIGAYLAPYALDFFTPEFALGVVFLLISLVSICILFFRRSYFFLLLFALAPFLSILLLLGHLKIPISEFKSYPVTLRMPESKLIKRITSRDSDLHILESPYLRLAPGLSLAYARPIPSGLTISLDGELCGIFLDQESIKKYDFFEFLPSFAPYVFKKNFESVLIVGLKNNLEALLASRWKPKNFFITEPDRSIHRFLREFYGDSDFLGAKVVRENARIFLKTAKHKFDLIVISRTHYFPSGTFGLQEDYETTVEAFKDYLCALKEDGLIYVQIFKVPPPRYEIRLLRNLSCAMQTFSLLPLENHLFVFTSWDTISFMVKKSPFSQSEICELMNFLRKRMFLLSSEAFLSPFFPIDEKSYPFDVRVTTDDRPFFHYFFKFSKIPEVEKMTKKGCAYFIHEGMAFFFLYLILIFLLTFLAIILSLKKAWPKTRAGEISIYFSSIGFGFMFLEVFFVHKMVLIYSSAIESFSKVVTSFLLFGGAGSLASSYISERRVFALILLVLPILFCIHFFGAANKMIFFIILPFFMGLFFPSGARILLKHNPDLLPFAYALNGAASVIAPPLASILAVKFGLSILVLFSILCYFFAALVLCIELLSFSHILAHRFPKKFFNIRRKF